jgi:hypothetical protein
MNFLYGEICFKMVTKIHNILFEKRPTLLKLKSLNFIPNEIR